MSQSTDIKVTCDPETGLCTPPQFNEEVKAVEWNEEEGIIYVGDPMCSWCWGISPQLNALKRYGEAQAIPFSMVMGGLRPGGGEEWNTEFKNFLKHHWEEVHDRSGQPFGYALFEQAEFDYDTEPGCRAVVTARQLDPTKAERFYELVQHHFYVKSQDPKEVEFYRPICRDVGIDFETFKAHFESDQMKTATQQDFALSAQWGVRGFPTVLYRKDNQLYPVARGYAEFDQMRDRIDSYREK